MIYGDQNKCEFNVNYAYGGPFGIRICLLVGCSNVVGGVPVVFPSSFAILDQTCAFMFLLYMYSVQC